jgi:hypothetical protein
MFASFFLLLVHEDKIPPGLEGLSVKGGYQLLRGGKFYIETFWIGQGSDLEWVTDTDGVDTGTNVPGATSIANAFGPRRQRSLKRGVLRP